MGMQPELRTGFGMDTIIVICVWCNLMIVEVHEDCSDERSTAVEAHYG